MASSSSLYGARDPSKTKHKPISSSSALAFSSNLSNLISSAKTTGSTSSTASKPKHTTTDKSSIFTAHNKNVKKRALADTQEQQQQQQQHRTSAQIGHTTESDLHRSKRKMLEKTRLYNAMKRGEYLDQATYEAQGLVDFDRKWADSQRLNRQSPSRSRSPSTSSSTSSTSSSHADTAPSSTDPITWTDEFGRQRTTSPHTYHRHLRAQRISAATTAALADASAYPTQPQHIIHGDTIQTAAFQPTSTTAAQMAALAAKRDKSATPPPDTHYDGNAEIRTKGTGFYGFSGDKGQREEEMRGLEEERRETERRRGEREEVLRRRREEVERRRGLVRKARERRREGEVDQFLEGLAGSMMLPPGGGGAGGGGDDDGDDDVVAVGGGQEG